MRVEVEWNWQSAVVGVFWQRTWDALEVAVHPLPFVAVWVRLERPS